MLNRIVPLVLTALLALILFFSTVFVVDQRQYAIVFALGEIKEVISEPGLHFKLPPPFQNVVTLDKRLLTLDSPDNDRFITAEKKNLIVDWFMKWRITDPKQYYRSFGNDERRAGDRLGQLVKAALNEEITKRTVPQMLSSERDKVMQGIRAKTTEDAKSVGVEVVDVRLKRVDFVADITASVYSRMEAERKRVANELRSTGQAESEKIRADADRQRTVIIAEAYRDAQKVKGDGDAKASAMYNAAFGQDPQFARFYRSLEAYRESFKNKSDVMVLDPSSDFFKAMRGSGAAEVGGGKR
jgi:modulator of FtsH protease HflC